MFVERYTLDIQACIICHALFGWGSMLDFRESQLPVNSDKQKIGYETVTSTSIIYLHFPESTQNFGNLNNQAKQRPVQLGSCPKLKFSICSSHFIPAFASKLAQKIMQESFNTVSTIQKLGSKIVQHGASMCCHGQARWIVYPYCRMVINPFLQGFTMIYIYCILIIRIANQIDDN